MQRTFDVAIIGGGPAGFTAAIWLARFLHSVVVVDSGDPRNWETRGVNGFLGLPHIRPPELRALGREEARCYGVALVDDIVTAARKMDDDEFSLEMVARESLPPRPGLPAIAIPAICPEFPGPDHPFGQNPPACPDSDGYDPGG